MTMLRPFVREPAGGPFAASGAALRPGRERRRRMADTGGSAVTGFMDGGGNARRWPAASAAGTNAGACSGSSNDKQKQGEGEEGGRQ